MPQQAVWRELLEEFSQLVREASQNFIFSFLHNKAAKKLQTNDAYTESTDLILIEKNIRLVTLSL